MPSRQQGRGYRSVSWRRLLPSSPLTERQLLLLHFLLFPLRFHHGLLRLFSYHCPGFFVSEVQGHFLICRPPCPGRECSISQPDLHQEEIETYGRLMSGLPSAGILLNRGYDSIPGMAWDTYPSRPCPVFVWQRRTGRRRRGCRNRHPLAATDIRRLYHRVIF